MREQIDDVLARGFLLGELSPEEQGEVEEQAFEDPETFSSIQAAADELTDDFLYDDLSYAERERFEQHFLSQPGRRADLRIARALQKYITQSVPSPIATSVAVDHREPFSWAAWLNVHRAQLRLSLAAVTILIVVAIGIWFAVRLKRQPNNPSPIQAQQPKTVEVPAPTNKGSETPTETAKSPAQKDKPTKLPLSPAQPPAPVYSFVLIPVGPVRGEGTTITVRLPSPSGIAQLQLPLIDVGSYSRFQATLQTNEGQVVRSWTNLRAKELEFGKGIQISAPAAVLKPRRHYRVVVRAISYRGRMQDIGEYYFQVTN